MARAEKMPAMFDALARYNSEVSRGIVHTESWKKQMTELQRAFGIWHQSVNNNAIYLSPARERRI